MQLTKEVLEEDRRAYIEQARVAQVLVNYIDGLLAYLDKPDVAVVAEEPRAEPIAEVVE